MRDERRYGRNGEPHAPLERARRAAERGEWREAADLLAEADAAGLVGPAELRLLAEVAYPAGRLDLAIETWERVHAAALESGDADAAAAAAVRVAMHLLLDTALMAPVRGWLRRAERLLEGRDESAAHAWLAVVRMYERLLTGRPEDARAWAVRATDVGSRHDPSAAALGRLGEARLLVLESHVEEGRALLDEVGAAAVAGELDPLSAGIVFCELVCALQGLAQYDAAEEWTEAMERWSRANPIGSLHGRCRLHRAEILRLRGSHEQAEREALSAYEELRPYLRRELGWPLSELGRIRLRRGDVEGAESVLLAAQRLGWDPQPGLALVRLAQGHVATAAASIRDALDRPLRVPSKELPPSTELRRAPLLEAQVEVELAAGELERARSAAAELELIARRFGSKALLAGAMLARARVRLEEGDAAAAAQGFAEAAQLWSDVGAPYETALAQIGLAEALRAAGRESEATVELAAGRAALDRLRGEAAAEPPPERSPAQELFRREGDYWTLAYGGRLVRIRNLRGLHYLSRLLAEPGREVPALDLVAAPGGAGARLPLGDAGELLDEQAKRAYRRRLEEIEDDLEQARALGDAERAAQADAERDFLVRELSRAVGLGGRDRRASSAAERARVGATRAIRHAIARIGEHHPELAEHLERTIRTGTFCAYLPEPRAPAAWRL